MPINGHVLRCPTNATIGGIEVCAYRRNVEDVFKFPSDCTDTRSDGTYTLTGLPADQ